MASTPQQGKAEIPVHGSTPGEENANLALVIGNLPYQIVSVTRSGKTPDTWIITYNYTPAQPPAGS